MLPSTMSTPWRWTSMELTTVGPCFQMRVNLSSWRISTWSILSGGCGFSSFSGLVGLTLHAGEVDLLAVRDDEVQQLHRRLVDVVFEGLGLAVQNGVPNEAGDGDDQAEGRTVHGLRDAFRENARLLARID